MTIKLYSTLTSEKPVETHEWTGTLAAWFESKKVDYQGRDLQPVVARLNSQSFPVDQWETITLLQGDDVELRYVQHGGIFKGLGSIIGSVFNAVFGFLIPSQRGGRDYNSPGQGRQLETSQAKANQAKLGDVVPELAGRHRRFPDYLTPPHRYFASPREQLLEFHACVGPGRYLIQPNDVKVGDTPFASLGSDASYQLFEPGANLSGVATHEHWYTADEVGGTSSGTAGLELSTELANRTNTQPPSYVFNGLTINRSQGGYPSGWGNGTTVTVTYPRPYAVTRETVGAFTQRNVFEGFFGHVLLGFTFFGGYTVGLLEDLGGGRKRVYFYKVDEQTQEVSYYNAVNPGTHTYDFSLNLSRVIQSVDEYSMQLQSVDGLFFESGVTVASTITFAGGTVYGEWASEFVVTPGNESTSTIEFDIFYPNGLAYINDDGALQNRTVGLEFQYRNLAGGSRVTVHRSYTQRTLDQIGFTERINVPAGRYACRMRRVGASSTSTQVQDTVHWYGLKARLRTRTSYPNWTTMSVKLRSGGRLAAQSENQINVVATRLLPALQSDGSWSAPQPTRDISAFVRYIAHSIGYTDENIDMDELRRLHGVWTSRGETCDYVFDLTTVKEAINTTLGAGMAELTVADGQIRPVREGVRMQFEHSYSPQNMTTALRRVFRAKRHDDHDGVEVEYTDSETWTQQTVICALPGSPKFKLEKLKLSGVTDRTRAWRIGMRRAREQRYRRWEYSFSTELDALNSEYGSYVALFDDIPGYGQSALLEHIEPSPNGALLHVSEPLEWEEGQHHMVGYRRPDGTLAGPWAATKGEDEFSVIADIPAPWPKVTLKQELPHIYFGPSERWAFPALITDIQPSGMESASVKGVNYDARVYADDDSSPEN